MLILLGFFLAHWGLHDVHTPDFKAIGHFGTFPHSVKKSPEGLAILQDLMPRANIYSDNSTPSISKLHLLSFTLLSVEFLSAVNEENNKKNATNDGSEQQIISYVLSSISSSLEFLSFSLNRLENDLNLSVPNLSTTNIPSLNILTTAQSSPNLSTSTPTTLNIANIPNIDDETNPIEESANISDQQQKQADETTTDEEDDEYTLLKRLKATTEQIEAPVEGDEDEEEEQQDEVKFIPTMKINEIFIF